MTTTLTIGIVAGEVSGDALGADFMAKMNALRSDITWVGVGGTLMAKQGLSSVIDMSRLSVMGIGEVIKHLPDLWSAKREILSALIGADIDIFVGIDAPDFNLRLSQSLKKIPSKSIFCVQYVSPSIWAWREGRIHTIKKATDLVLCLFPFELPVYQRHSHPAVCVGHPLLDRLHADDRDTHLIFGEFLDKFGLSALQDATPICVMAGSRLSEIRAMLPLLIDAMTLMDTGGQFVYLLPTVNAEHQRVVSATIQDQAPALIGRCRVICGDDVDGWSVSQHAMNASKLILLASGTATLEALLLHRPMVVIYQVNALTYAIAKRLIKIPYVSLPNILSHHLTNTAIVPELIQDEASAQRIAQSAQAILKDPSTPQARLVATTQALRTQSHSNSAQAVLTHFFQRQAVI